jgi:hypothetical protein
VRQTRWILRDTAKVESIDELMETVPSYPYRLHLPKEQSGVASGAYSVSGFLCGRDPATACLAVSFVSNSKLMGATLKCHL